MSILMKICDILFSAWFALTPVSLTNRFPPVFTVDPSTQYQTFEGFGTSSCWWAQAISDEATAREIARALYDDETGLGLDIFRYNIGGGEADNPDCRIGDVNRRTESFYALNPQTGEYEYDFTRDANARRMLSLAVEYGAKQVILFCNSPHFSMTASGHASGGLTKDFSNLPHENYAAFVDYVLTIADKFVEWGYPVTAISPINEPQWSWGGEWVGQEGCHYTARETAQLLSLFATTMQQRHSPYALRGVESGQMSADFNEYIDEFFADEALNSFCDTFSGHSYWMDNKMWEKLETAKYLSDNYPGKKYEMSEWCELPLTLDSKSIDSGLYMANVIVQDLSLMNAVSWQSWTAVNGDGVMDIIDGSLTYYSRYYAYKQFSSFIKPGMTRIYLNDGEGFSKNVASVAFDGADETVIVFINNEKEDIKITLACPHKHLDTYTTDASHNCEKTYSGAFGYKPTLPGRSITTFVLKK